MNTVPFEVKNERNISCCPKCNNKKKFNGHSEQVSEDGCEIWITCYSCDYNPFIDHAGSCIESIMGELDEANLMMALDEWSNIISSDLSA